MRFLKKYWFELACIAILVFAIFVRFYKVTSFPPSLYGEEVALGYDAYSVLKTGKDHFGNPAPLVAFESYGDYKPALYFYAIMPFITLVGLSELAVRLPSMIAGVMIVIGVGLLARELSRRIPSVFTNAGKSRAKIFQVIALFVAAVSPWAIQFSRAGWESNLATAFIVWGVLFGFWTEKRAWWQKIPTFLFFALSMYTYHSARVVAPLLGLSMMLMWSFDAGFWTGKWKKNIVPFLRQVIPVGLIFIILISPLLLSLRDPQTQERLDETSIFADGHIAVKTNYYQDLLGHTVLSRILYHRYVLMAQEYIANYLTHFSVQFLFGSGDANPRHSVQFVGELYVIEAAFLFLGFVCMLRNWRKEFFFILLWIVIGVIPAGLTQATPHALRILDCMPAFLLIVSVGVLEAIRYLEKSIQIAVLYLFPKLKKNAKSISFFAALLIIFFAYAYEFGSFWEFYSKDYSKLNFGVWNYGYREIIAEVNKRKNNEAQVYFLRDLERPAMYYWFFSQSDPREVQKIDHALQKDQGPKIQFGNISFVDSISEVHSGLVASPVSKMNDLVKSGKTVRDVTVINDPTGKPIWSVYHLD